MARTDPPELRRLARKASKRAHLNVAATLRWLHELDEAERSQDEQLGPLELRAQ